MKKTSFCILLVGTGFLVLQCARQSSSNIEFNLQNGTPWTIHLVKNLEFSEEPDTIDVNPGDMYIVTTLTKEPGVAVELFYETLSADSLDLGIQSIYTDSLTCNQRFLKRSSWVLDIDMFDYFSGWTVFVLSPKDFADLNKE